MTDQGKEFVNLLSEELWKLLGVIHSTTTAHHPQCDAQAEVANKTIAKYLSGFVDESTLDWELYLAPMMFSYNTSFHKSIQSTPFFLTFGMQPRLPNFPAPDLNRKFYGESSAAELHQRMLYARDLARRTNEDSTEKMKEFHDRRSAPHNLRNGQWVLLDEHSFLHKNTKLAPKYTGPHQIIQLKGDNDVELQMKNGKRLIVNASRVKPYTFPLPEPAEPEAKPKTEFSRFKPKEKKRVTIPKEEESADDPIETEEDPYLPLPKMKTSQREPMVEIKEEPMDPEYEPEPVTIKEAPAKAKRTYQRKKPRWEYKVIDPTPKEPEVIPDDPKGGRVTRYRAKLLIQQNSDVPADGEKLDAIKRKIRRIVKKEGWNMQKRRNFTTYGDIYRSKPYKNYSTADSQPLQSDPESEEEIESDTDTIDTLQSDPDIDESDESTEQVESEVDSDESSEGTPSPEAVFRTPEAPTKYPDHPTDAFRATGSEYPEYTGTAFPPKRTKHVEPPKAKDAKKNLFGEFEEFVLGPRPGASKEATLGPRGERPPDQRRTRATGPAPPIGELPKVPLERKTRGRGKPWK